MPLSCFGNCLCRRFHTPFCHCFQSTVNAGANFGNLFISKIVWVIYEVAVRQTLSD